MEAIPTWEATLKTQRLEREGFELQVQEAQAHRIAKAREQESLRRQRARLVSDMTAWEHADRLRRFIAAVQEIGSQDDETRAWLEWAIAQVHALDPLCSRVTAVTNLNVKLEDHFTGYPTWEKPPTDWWNK